MTVNEYGLGEPDGTGPFATEGRPLATGLGSPDEFEVEEPRHRATEFGLGSPDEVEFDDSDEPRTEYGLGSANTQTHDQPDDVAHADVLPPLSGQSLDDRLSAEEAVADPDALDEDVPPRRVLE